ncbi:hypothetical protein C4D60_Mb09t04510 [Musa balbisiana]|uniref:Uncharacterized protein n=1 Tax=Musa balbisiana TaxID=52838 RepID=A0A4V6T405_MUSBA|nr:hypothetical protein C4D60_Mb09t04510 [Musa balbisiana]
MADLMEDYSAPSHLFANLPVMQGSELGFLRAQPRMDHQLLRPGNIDGSSDVPTNSLDRRNPVMRPSTPLTSAPSANDCSISKYCPALICDYIE